MKLRKLGIALFGMLLAVSLVACGGGSDSSSQSTSEGGDSQAVSYIIVTDVAFAPFEFAEADGTYVGIDVELLDAVAKDQGFDYTLDPVGFDAALQNVLAGQADGVIAGMSITEERKERFDFSSPYYDSTVCCAAKNGGEVKSLEDLKDKTVAIKTGTQSAKWAQSIQDEYGFKTVEFKDSDIMYQDVLSGNSVACFEDTPVMKYAVGTGSVDLKIIDEVDSNNEFASQYGFAVAKGKNAELLQKFDAGLANIKKDGTYDKIVNKYIQSVK